MVETKTRFLRNTYVWSFSKTITHSCILTMKNIFLFCKKVEKEFMKMVSYICKNLNSVYKYFDGRERDKKQIIKIHAFYFVKQKTSRKNEEECS